MFDLNEKIKKARKEAIGLSVLAILTAGALYLTTLEEVEAVSASDQETIHTVKSGDTLWRISVNNHVSLDNLKSNLLLPKVLSLSILVYSDKLSTALFSKASFTTLFGICESILINISLMFMALEEMF